MTTSTRLGLRVKPSDEEILVKLANHLERNLSDTVRFAIKYTARHHGLLPEKKPPKVTKDKKANE